MTLEFYSLLIWDHAMSEAIHFNLVVFSPHHFLFCTILLITLLLQNLSAEHRSSLEELGTPTPVSTGGICPFLPGG